MEKTYQKNKGGRPSVIASEKKNFKLYCYLDETENEVYIQFKKMNIGSNSFHLKNALFQYIGNDDNQIKKLNKETIKMMNDLNRLAGNVNQVAKHLNKNLTFSYFFSIIRQATRLPLLCETIINRARDLMKSNHLLLKNSTGQSRGRVSSPRSRRGQTKTSLIAK